MVHPAKTYCIEIDRVECKEPFGGSGGFGDADLLINNGIGTREGEMTSENRVNAVSI
jgi:hypothetical protein